MAAYQMIDHAYDVVVVGAGGAGLRATLGMQVVVEDYVGHEAARFGLIIAIRLLCLLLAAFGIFAVLTLAFGA